MTSQIERAAAIAADMYVSQATLPEADARRMQSGMALQIAASVRRAGGAKLRKERDYGGGRVVQMGCVLVTAHRVEEFDAEGKSLRFVVVP